MHTFTEKKLLLLKPQQIRQSKFTQRTNFDERELKTLARSISLIGIIQPLTVRKSESGYEIISGERRLRAAVMAGLRRVPCVLHKTDEKTAAFYAMAENMQHTPLNFFEEAQGINNLMLRYRLTMQETAMRLGISQTEIQNKLKLLRLDEPVRKKIIAASLTEAHARQLLRLDEDDRENLLSIIISERLNATQCEQKISEIINPQISKEQPQNTAEKEEVKRKTVIEDSRIFSNSLEKLICAVENTGIDVEFKKNESSKYVEYRFKIKKEEQEGENFKQLKIC